MKRKEKEKEEQLALANTLSRIVLTNPDVTEMARGFVFELKQLMPISWTTIGIIDESKGSFHLFTLSSKLRPDKRPDESIPLDDTPVAWLIQHKKTLLQPDLSTERRFRTGDYWLEKGLRSIVYMPLFFGGVVFGSLIFASNRPNVYGERELKLLRYATSQLATPVRYSRLYTHIVEDKQDSPISEEWITRTEQTLRELTGAISEYALHLKSHTAAIQGLSEASQELKRSAAEQNRVVADIVNAIRQAPSRTVPTTTGGQGPAPPPEKDTYPPGCHRGHRQSAHPETLVEKQRKFLEKRGAGKRPVQGRRAGDKDSTEVPSKPSRYKWRLSPPL